MIQSFHNYLNIMNSVIAFLGTLLLSTSNIGPEYTVEKSMGSFEIRTYEPWIVA